MTYRDVAVWLSGRSPGSSDSSGGLWSNVSSDLQNVFISPQTFRPGWNHQPSHQLGCCYMPEPDGCPKQLKVSMTTPPQGVLPSFVSMETKILTHNFRQRSQTVAVLGLMLPRNLGEPPVLKHLLNLQVQHMQRPNKRALIESRKWRSELVTAQLSSQSEREKRPSTKERTEQIFCFRFLHILADQPATR